MGLHHQQHFPDQRTSQAGPGIAHHIAILTISAKQCEIMATALHHPAASPTAHIQASAPFSPAVTSPITPGQIPAQWGNPISNDDEDDCQWLDGYNAALREKQHGVHLNLSQAQLNATYGAVVANEFWLEGYMQAVNTQMQAWEDVELGTPTAAPRMQAFDGIEEGKAVEKRSRASRRRVALAIGVGVFVAAAAGAGLAVALAVVLHK